MASIFGGQFVDNIRRVYSSARRTADASPAPESFSKVLENTVENPPAVKHEAMPADARFQLDKRLTNFLPQEEANQTLTSPIEPQLSVKEPTPPVSLPPPNQRVLIDPAVKSEARALLTRPTTTETATPPAIPAVPKITSFYRTMEKVPFMQDLVATASGLPPAIGPKFITEIIQKAGEFHGLDPDLSLAVAKAESNLNPTAVSKDGHASKGVFQLLDSTAQDMMRHVSWTEEYDPFNPALNTHLGVGYLKRLHKIFSKETNLGFNIRTVAVSSAEELEKLAVAAFNAGEGRVARAQHRAQLRGGDPTKYEDVAPYLPQTTRTYVERVLNTRTALASKSLDSNMA